MSIILFLVTLFISLMIVRIGAIAFQITGLSAATSMFQAISCFTGTGFTTREAELITGHHQRRRIACVLMILGGAGIVTMIATFANSLNSPNFTDIFSRPFFHSIIWEELLPIINILVILLISYILFKVFLKVKLSKRVTKFLRVQVEGRFIKTSLLSDYIPVAQHCGLFRINMHARGKLREALKKVGDIKDYDAEVLAIERFGEITRSPGVKVAIENGDQLVCFGSILKLEELMGNKVADYKNLREGN